MKHLKFYSILFLFSIFVYKVNALQKILDGYFLSDEEGLFLSCKHKFDEYFCLEKCVESGAKDGYCVGHSFICFCKYEVGSSPRHFMF
uniref:Putative sodium channel toxin Ts38 n=2 Tax=Tityus TaxID=6886 RepID=SCX38_TITSE|nr:RecName: Full=Putative sodium channel toxin Ts38; AltName: Full=Tityustoxin-38; Flags: Precursor [Tityus serrulatus]QPD99029.1 putative sodium channel toxin Ts38 [Tityus serrulatus]WLF82737.1 putative NaTx [Tityus melici]